MRLIDVYGFKIPKFIIRMLHPIDLLAANIQCVPIGAHLSFRPLFPYSQEDAMSKKSHRRKNAMNNENVHDFPNRGSGKGWDPLMQAGPRDQSYVRHVRPKSENQRELLEALDSNNLIVALGPAGTGKTYLSIAKAVEAFDAGKVARIILTRPAIEAGETLGFLPGELENKMAPYLRPLFDALSDRMGAKQLNKLMADGSIEIAPVGFMRGRTLNNAYIVIDEAQNCTYAQIKMLLTRLGWHSTMCVTGDPDQSDLLPGMSGLGEIANRLESLSDVAILRLTKADVVRHPLVASMLSVV